MANKKLPYEWPMVKPGNIISFRYKSKKGDTPKTQSILVLNPKITVNLKGGGTTQHLIGIKLEESNKNLLRLTKKEIDILEKIGSFEIVDKENNLFTLKIKRSLIINEIKGIKPQAYEMISRSIDIFGQYRTYDFSRAKTSAVYLEPIKIYTEIKEDKTIEEKKETKKPEEPKKPKQPKKPSQPKQPTEPDNKEIESALEEGESLIQDFIRGQNK
tara:strand:+ start:1379 stop:2023 length:645 start_codon:yes stop_codon:yes gene_type:complete